VIAILDWELSTIGNPLMDAIYVISPFWIDFHKASPHDLTTSSGGGVGPNLGISNSTATSSPYAPANRATSGMPDPDELLDRYSQITGFDPRLEGQPPGKDFEIAKIFHYVRGGTISHGIHARTYAGQASSDFSHVYFQNTTKMLDAAWGMVRRMKGQDGDKARL
jgi:aminoglycoside phosphotransferase (APT) family kinase protein